MADTLNNESPVTEVTAPTTDTVADQATTTESPVSPQVTAETAESVDAQAAGQPEGASNSETDSSEAESGEATGQPTRQPSMAQVMEDDEFAAYLSGAETLARGSLVQGVVVRLEDNGSVLLDIGHKSEAIIPRNEIGDDELSVGDQVEGVVIRSEDDEGHPVVSKRRADFERIKREVVEAKNSGAILQATVKEAIKGGLIVNLGVDAFVPASHIDKRLGGNIDRLIGQVLPVKVIEVEFSKKRADKVIASHRLAEEETRSAREAEAWQNIEKDKIVEGTVRRITDFGAFIDLGGVDGLLHVREMAWGRVDHPSSIVKKGQKLQVLILDIDEETKRIALGLKQLLPDPWKKAAKNYRVGQTLNAKIVRLAPTVAFAELEPGVEAIIPVGEIAEERIKEPADKLEVGQEVEGRIKSILTNQRRITMSLRAAVQDRERRETRSQVREVNQRAESGGGMSLGDLFGKELRAMAKRGQAQKDAREAEAAEAQATEAEVAQSPEAAVEEQAPATFVDEAGTPDEITHIETAADTTDLLIAPDQSGLAAENQEAPSHDEEAK